MKYILILLAFSGCNWQEAPMDVTGNYQCSAEQMKAVDWQFSTCMKTSFVSSHCLTEAMRSNCARRTP